MVLLITYELKRPGQDYDSLYEAIKGISTIWHHPLTSHWFIQTSLFPQQVWERLASHIDKNDNLLVIRVTNIPGYSGWMSKETWNWLGTKVY